MTADLKISKILNCEGDLCPLPIYKASRVLKAMGAGEFIEIICTDPGSLEDFPAFARQTGYELVHSQQYGEKYHFILKA